MDESKYAWHVMYVCMKIFYNCVPRFMLPCKQESRKTIIKYAIFPLITWRCLSYACDKGQIICPTKISVETLKIPSLQKKDEITSVPLKAQVFSSVIINICQNGGNISSYLTMELSALKNRW